MPADHGRAGKAARRPFCRTACATISHVTRRDKRSVSLPPDLSHRIEEEAAREGTTFSGWLAETAARRLKLETGRRALAEWERENGPLTQEELAEGRTRARALLGRTDARRKRRSA